MSGADYFFKKNTNINPRMVKNITANHNFSQQGCHSNSNLKLQAIPDSFRGKQQLFQVSDGNLWLQALQILDHHQNLPFLVNQCRLMQIETHKQSHTCLA